MIINKTQNRYNLGYKHKTVNNSKQHFAQLSRVFQNRVTNVSI